MEVADPTGLATGGSTAGTATGFVINQIYAMPFFVGGAGARVDSLGVAMAAASVGVSVARMGIYRVAPPSARSIYPTSLVVDFGDVVLGAGTPGNTQRNTATVPTTLANGLYYTAFKLLSGNPTLAFLNGANSDAFVPGFVLDTSSPPLPYAAGSLFVAGAAGPLESTFPAGGAVSRAFAGEATPVVSVNFGV
jgi:hypothetical protein